MKRLWLIQATGNALLFWSAFTWLGIRDSKSWQLVETGVFGLMIAALWLWLQNGTFFYCAHRPISLWKAYRESLRTLAVFSAVAIGFVVIAWALGQFHDPLTRAGQRTASWLTFHLRKPVKPTTWVGLYLAALWVVRWIVLPVFTLPIAAQRVWRLAPRLFWLQYLAALAVGYWLPSVLMTWVPKLTGTAAQIFSFSLRFGIAYALIITAWLSIISFACTRVDSQTNI